MSPLDPAVDAQVEAIHQDVSLSPEEKLRDMAAVLGITEPVTAPQLFAHACGFNPGGGQQ